MGIILNILFLSLISQDGDRVEFSWFVNTNEDVGDFHLELRTRAFPQTTLFQRDISYDTRYQVLDHLPGGEELSLCLLVKSSSGRVRRWRQDQCRQVGPFTGAPRGEAGVGKAPALVALVLLLLLERAM